MTGVLRGKCGDPYLRLRPSPTQMAPSSVTVPLVEMSDDLPPDQMAPEPATEGLSTTDRAPLLPPQMKPLPEVTDGGTGVRLMPAARPFPSPQIAPCGQEAPHRTAVSWMYTKPSSPAMAKGDAAFWAVPAAVTAPYTSRAPAPVSKTRRSSFTADFISRALTVAGVSVESFCSIRAAAPATIGAA